LRGQGERRGRVIAASLLLAQGRSHPDCPKTKTAPNDRSRFKSSLRDKTYIPRFAKRLLNFDTRPPRSVSCCEPPAHAGWVDGSISRFIVSPSLPQVERVRYSVPSVMTTLMV